jgi:hypothetical protein
MTPARTQQWGTANEFKGIEKSFQIPNGTFLTGVVP